MPRIERFEQTKKPMPAILSISVLILVLFGIWFQNCTQKQLAQEVRISNVTISEYTPVYVEVHYTVSNQAAFDRQANLLLKIYSDKGELVASSMFQIEVPAHRTQGMIKIVDKLIRPLVKNEKPVKATLEVYQRKVL